ncbi:MAG TPA: GNAT family N-acetyltransferase [Acidimicrobiales bacterium]|jgi:GNAT superfamily N-acetyltransferase|nr:GNAT family N-acetyltransferase [Acidimicrobiales bacterium]
MRRGPYREPKGGATIRAARPDEFASLVEIERRAGARFAEVSELAHFADSDPTEIRDIEAAHVEGLVWVADVVEGPRVGWAYASRLDESIFIEEIDVLIEYGRQGIGRALIEAVADRARADGLAAVTLTTDAHVAWNRPLYEKLGFTVVLAADQSADLAAKVADEITRGLPIERRVAMRRPVS